MAEGVGLEPTSNGFKDRCLDASTYPHQNGKECRTRTDAFVAQNHAALPLKLTPT